MRAVRERSAVISACGSYRYVLERRWTAAPLVTWVMLNPSFRRDKRSWNDVFLLLRGLSAGTFVARQVSCIRRPAVPWLEIGGEEPIAFMDRKVIVGNVLDNLRPHLPEIALNSRCEPDRRAEVRAP
uniref:hypothetical protein n=1 Tax=Nonomuraea sp. CA-251285 TaxID=3240002 RepID=UPI003F4974B4